MAFGASPAFTWRFALAFGAVPTLVAVAMRSRMEENDEFTDAHKQEEALSVGHWKATRAMLSTYRNVLIGTAGCWFLLDVSFYANGLFSSEITAAVQLGDSLDAKVKNSLLVALISLPGYYFSVAFLDKVGRWRLQFFGFVILAALFFFLAAMLPRLRKMPFVLLLLYGATFFFSNFGPNATTYIIPGEIYPSAVKATCHGISAAAGKLGASLAAVFFAPVAEAGDARSIMAVCGVAALFGSLWTLLFIPDYTPESLPAFVKEHTEKFHSRLGVVGGGAGRAVGRPVEYQVLPVRPKRPEGGPESEMQTEGRRASPGYGIPRSPKPEARGDTEMTIFGQTTDS
uniref:Major facilitator superfamily (MFS) profile domain-containing protein n=1 Tax=Chromera velia CCMP2878 TaxID=1169474 RepID=A0A0G4HQP6_9ALVE|eukprot:Cvel_30289.t1-p1 / transcript=Cvel_30289.t1 / gene=Cvel_30289 / organism=Chromera_velia_CCMP2878 / gene_product=Probable inorganic phosphate transporter 1-7, putative / transcript_product=Probable inorganic phosphate transporter 1-7, putative / location=Cvel_scaffold4295:80-1105(+) / protein_length=342 / sequence_SO=supercontig / SO=protein_coding / is_pseudo=false